MKLTSIAFFCVALLPWSAQAQTNAPVPTLAEIKADFDAAKYQDVLRKSQRALSAKGDPSKQPDRAAIENLKGEAQLHLRQFPQAIESFSAAAKDATEPKDVGQYRAMALLVKRSPGGRYVPKPVPGAGEKPQPLDIVVTDSRKQAFAALYTDESKVVQAKVDSVKQKQALKPMMDLTRDLLDLRSVEIAGTGSAAGSSKMLGEISDQAARLMGDGLNRMSAAVDKIAKTANESYDSTITGAYGQSQTIVSKRGLTSTDKSTLTEVVANCKDIELAAEQLGEGGDEKGSATTKPAAANSAISKVQQQATALKNRADQLLNGDYADRTAGGNPGTVTGQQQRPPQQQPPPPQQPPQQPPPPRN